MACLDTGHDGSMMRIVLSTGLRPTLYSSLSFVITINDCTLFAPTTFKRTASRPYLAFHFPPNRKRAATCWDSVWPHPRLRHYSDRLFLQQENLRGKNKNPTKWV